MSSCGYVENPGKNVIYLLWYTVQVLQAGLFLPALNWMTMVRLDDHAAERTSQYCWAFRVACAA